MRRDRTAEEYFAVVFAVDHRPQRILHSPLGYHAARERGRILEVAARTGAHLAQKYCFSDTPAKIHRNVLQQALAILAVAILLGKHPRHTERTAARNDRDL